MENILITGGTGFIGSHTCLKLLELGYKITVIDSLVNSTDASLKKVSDILKIKINGLSANISFEKGDIRNNFFLNDVFNKALILKTPITSVIHFAGLKSVKESNLKPLEYWDVNVSGSINLLKIMDKYSCRNIVFSSSATIYGSNKEKNSFKEDSKINPINIYGETKANVEKILSYLHFSNPEKWNIACLRYFNPIGAHPSGLIGESPLKEPENLFPYICQVASGKRKILKIFGNDWPTKDGTCIRDFIHVMDLVDAHICALENLHKGKHKLINLNIGTGKGTSVLELIRTFEEVNSIKIPFIIHGRRNGDSAYVVADNSLSHEILNWKPKRSLVEMCRDGWNWQKKNPLGYRKN